MSGSLLEKEIGILGSGVWGTIGPHSVRAADMLSGVVGSRYGLLCHSRDAAYEAVLRHFGAFRGAKTAVGTICEPSDALVASYTGSDIVFLDDPSEADGVACAVIGVTRDFDGFPLDEISQRCRSRSIPLILSAAGYIRTKWRGQSLLGYADAAVYSLEKGSEIYAGKGGFIATNDLEVYSGAFAWHNCGRAFGEGASLNIEGIIGGDFRVSEWTAAVVESVIESGSYGEAADPERREMSKEPVYSRIG